MHNLKNINVEIPRDKLVVITGVSGSGKSSLAFDTIYAEGQRRYVESLSAYARQFLQMTEKPDVESVDGLSPAISIDQKSSSRNPRSTVGTVTEIYDYLRLLYAKIGKPHCPVCNAEISKQTVTAIVDHVASMEIGKRIMLLAPVVRQKRGSHTKELTSIKNEGFIRVRINGELKTLNEEISLNPDEKHTIEIVVDRMVIKDYSPKKVELTGSQFIEEINPDKTRLADSIELTLKHGDGFINIVDFDSGEETQMSERYSCPSHPEVQMPSIEPRSFSFNSPHGACPECHGLGNRLVVQKDLIFTNSDLTIEEGAILPWASSNWHMGVLKEVAKKYKFKLSNKISDLSKKQLDIILYGTGDDEFFVEFNSKKMQGNFKASFEGVINNLERRYLECESENTKKQIEKYMKLEICPSCNGNKLRKEVLGITINKKSIIDITKMSIDDAYKFFSTASEVLSDSEKKIARMIFDEVTSRLSFLIHVGVSYLSLNRTASTLSGGEAQRIRLATQIGSALQGVLYVLDEPSIGLHQKDNSKLIETMEHLRNLGNTVLVVEHDEDTMRAADHIIEIGPEAGKYGGLVVAEGSLNQIMKNKDSVTGAFLSGKEEIKVPMKRRMGNKQIIKVKGAKANNLKNVDLELPLGTFIGISGVSGSGKSTLINGILARHLSKVLHRSEKSPLEHEEITGVENVDKIIHIDQSAIGRTPRSNPATYTGVFTDIRELFATQPDAKMRGYTAGRFSFNVKGGRCEACSGEGLKKIEMHFLPDIYVSCDECKGTRYNREALEIKWRGNNISDVLNMTIKEAHELFKSIPNIKNRLQTLEDVGLSYIQLGQSATTLSGGEAQRVKLATELARKSTGKTIYILDEPTTGLHFQDIRKLLDVLQRLVDKGNTVIVIEHNLDVLKTCDHIVDLGPNGGSGGGQIVAQGTPEDIARVKKSYTGQYLKKLLNGLV